MSGFVSSMSIPTILLGDLVQQLSGNELKVMLFLALQTNGFATSADGIRIRQIAAGTKLSKKEVRIAIRILTINAAFSGRFQMAEQTEGFSAAAQRKPEPQASLGPSLS